jgi:hypothetical protein
MKKHLILIAILLYSCSSTSDSTDELSIDERYDLAVEDAKHAEPYEISRDLIAIEYYGDSLAGEGNLRWKLINGKQHLLVVTWTKYYDSYIGNEGKPDTSGNWYTWVTCVPEMQDFFKSNQTEEKDLHLRIAQLLGMPHDTKNDWFLELWVDPDDLFRPSPDPEIDDNQAELYFSSKVSPEHKNWINDLITSTYTSIPPFPWTRLGYTYDWGNPNSEIGLSEFVLKSNSVFEIESITKTSDYLVE